ncbi:MAG: hypothetical protein M1829_005897 [Trizodia sp. TS-e1964]|nr:MAG: hypothetical protein M1829_005897 [Trizodia sp. TS-e1964]
MDEVENVQDFVQKLESIDLPNQLVSALGDSLLQHFLLLRPSAAADMRIDSWLSAYFEDELLAFQEERAGRNSLTDVLQKCLSYIKFTKFLLPAVDKFLQKYLYQWDGKSDRPVILEILAYVSISSFDDLFSTYFSPLERALLDNTTGSQVHLLEYYTGVLRQWTISSFLTYAPEASPEDPASPILQVETEAFARLADRSDALCLSILESKQSTAPPPSLLAFYEQIIFALEESPLAVLSAIRITAPSAYLIYQLAFTNCLSTISRLCMILAGYKRALEKAMQVTGTFEEGSHSAQQVHKFNGYLLDICNCLWRSRAFNIEDANATGCMVPTAILPLLKQYAEAHKLALPTMFSLSHSTTLCALAAECFRDLEDAASAKGALKTRHQGVVTQTSLLRLAQNGGLRISWADYRFEVLKWLELKGVNGVGELMYNTMKHLMVTREKWLAERNKGRG